MPEFIKKMLLEALTTEGGIEKMDNGLTNDFRPIIDILPKLSPVVGKDAAVAVLTIQKIANEVAENEEVKTEVKKWKTRNIKRRKEILDEYKEAGFTATQAFEMLRLDVMNAKAAIANASSNVKLGK
jgi:hypothetical protein